MNSFVYVYYENVKVLLCSEVMEAVCAFVENTDDRCKEEISDSRLTVQEISGAVDEDSWSLSAVLCTLRQAKRIQATTC